MNITLVFSNGLTAGLYEEYREDRDWCRNMEEVMSDVFTTVDTIRAEVLAGAMIALGGLGNALGGTLSDRVGRTTVIATALACSGLVSAAIGLLGGLPLPALVVVVLVWGVALTMDSAPTSTAITEIVDDERVGTALSIQSFVGFSTTVVSPVVFGAALDVGGFALAFPTLAAGALVALGSLAALRYAERRRLAERGV